MSSPAAQFLNSFVNSNQPKSPTTTTVAGYTIGHLIGYGSTSIIRKAYSSDASPAAVKIIPYSSSSALKLLLREAATWSILSHEHILPLFAFTHSHSHLYFFTLYCPAGSLLDVLKSQGNPALLQDDAGMIFRQVVRGLSYLHLEAKFVHRDIKLENVLIDEMGVCRIADFGLAVRFNDSDSHFNEQDQDIHHPLRYHRNSTSTHSALSLKHHNHHNHFLPGSLPYASPELLLPPPILLDHPNSIPRPHPSQDIWALGVLLYALLTGSLPFFDSFEPRLQLKILNGTFRSFTSRISIFTTHHLRHLLGSYSPPLDIGLGAERILKACLDKNIHTRWSISMVDEVAWGVGWGREGDRAGAAEIDEDEHDNYVHHLQVLPPRNSSPEKNDKKRSRSKSLDNPISRSVSPSVASLSPSPSYRFPPSSNSLSRSPSPSSSPSPSRSPLSPVPQDVLDIEIMSSPRSQISDFEKDSNEILRGRKMRSLPAPLPKTLKRPKGLCSCHQHRVEEEEDCLEFSMEFDRAT